MEPGRRVVFPRVREAVWEAVEPPDAAQLGPTQVLVRVERTLVSAGTELAIYSGSHIGFTVPGSTYPRMPHHPGYSAAGTVVGAGSEVRRFSIGDRIAGSLPHASWAVADGTTDVLVNVPEGVTLEQACLARLAGIAMQGVRMANVRLGETVVVFGQGLIGQLARQHAALEGASETFGVDLFRARLDVARRLGATHVIDATHTDAVEAVMAATGGRGADVVIEATGNPAVIPQALRTAADLGRVVLLGSPRGRVEIDPYSDIHRKGLTVIGAHARTADLPHNPTLRWNTTEQLRLCVELIGKGRLRTDGLIGHHFPADATLQVYEQLLTEPQDYLGVVLEWV
jgi:2-desacetyl-2-hydroxyethyl bacteriochlorophyllide A dehydrogenase